MAKFHVIEKQIEMEFKSAVMRVVCLKNYQIFMIFENYSWEVFDINNQQKIYSGNFENQQISFYPQNQNIIGLSGDQVAFYDKLYFKLRVLNIKINSIQDWSILPTKTACPQRVQMDQIMDATSIVCLPLTQTLVVFEQFQSNSQLHEVVSFYKESKQLFEFQFQAPVQINYIKSLNDSDTVIVYGDVASKKYYEFHIFKYDFQINQKCFFQYKVQAQSPLEELVVVDVSMISNDQLCFWTNCEQQSEPRALIAEIQLDCQEEIVNAVTNFNEKNLAVIQNQWIFMDLYFSDFKKDIFILPVDDENWVVQAKNFQKLQKIQEFYEKSHQSLDSKFLFTYQQDQLSNQNQTDKSYLLTGRLINLTCFKSQIVFIMEQKGLMDMYGPRILSYVTDILQY